MVSIHLPVGTLRCETIAPLRGVRSSVSLPQSEIQMIPNHNQKNTTSPRSSSPSCLLPSPQKAPQRNVSWREKTLLELKVLGSSLESQTAPDKGSGGNPGIRQGKKLGNHLQFETAKMQQCSRILCLLGLGLVIFVGPKKTLWAESLVQKEISSISQASTVDH